MDESIAAAYLAGLAAAREGKAEHRDTRPFIDYAENSGEYMVFISGYRNEMLKSSRVVQ